MSDSIKDIKNNFFVTGVGSLPYKETDKALDFVFQVLSYNIPFWPQLPRQSFYENMYVQFCEKFPGIRVDEVKKSVWVDTKGKNYLLELEECFVRCQASDVDYFAISQQYSKGLYLMSQRLMDMNWQGWVKAQIIGPLSLGLSLLDENKNPILYNAELTELLSSFLSLKAAWIVRQLKVNTKTKIIIFIDEPYLVAVGTAQCSLPKQLIIDKINQVAKVIHESGALVGLHCCGNTDWEMALSMDIDILNFDAYGYLDKLFLYSSALDLFLKNGHMLAIGIVPNDETLLEQGLEERLFEILKKHSRILKNGALITTTCGCSALSEDLTMKAHKLCVSLAERLRGGF